MLLKKSNNTSLLPEHGLEDNSNFESKVIEVLMAMGYKIKIHHPVGAYFISLYGEFQVGTITLRLMIECRQVKEDLERDVRSFVSLVCRIKSAGCIDKGIFITDLSVRPSTKDYAESKGVECVTYTQLIAQLVNFDDYADKVIEDFESSPLSNTYMDIRGTKTEDYEGNETAEYIDSIDSFVKQCLLQEDHQKLALLGDFGTGKSAFCRHFTYRLAQKYKIDKMTRIPILVDLRGYDARFNIQTLILNILYVNFELQITAPIFCCLQQHGRFLLLFDGLDEMDPRACPETIRENMNQLIKISSIPANKFIITCRTHFFHSRISTELLEDFDFLYIPKWEPPQLTEYFQKNTDNQWDSFIDRIRETCNLTELARTPFFLEMIAQMNPKPGNDAKRIEVYRQYTDQWIDKEPNQKDILLSPGEKRKFLIQLAINTYTENKISCHYSEFNSLIWEYLTRIQDQYGDQARILANRKDIFLASVKTCTFLVWDNGGNYYFRHKSFQEFFAAEVMAEHIRNGSCQLLEITTLPVEVRGFLADFLRDDPPVRILLSMLDKAEQSILRDNLLSLISVLRIKSNSPKYLTQKKTTQDTNLAASWMRGDRDSFASVYSRYFFEIYQYIQQRLPERDIAKEITNDAFINLWKNRHLLESVEQIKLRLYIIAKNKSTEYLRKKEEKRLHIDYLNTIDWLEQPYPLQVSEPSGIYEVITKAIGKLTTHEQMVFQLLYHNNESVTEIALQLNLGHRSVYALYNQAIKKLKGYLHHQNILEGFFQS
jgi:RNA polymerase sigma factor (sigma-70 family)